MNEGIQDWAKRPNTIGDTIKGLILLVGLGALYFVVFSNTYFLAAFAAAIVLFSFGVIAFPQSVEARREDKKELQQRIKELQTEYPVERSVDWTGSQADWEADRKNRIEERAASELAIKRQEKVGFPWNLPWWGRVLSCLPLLLAGAYFFSYRL